MAREPNSPEESNRELQKAADDLSELVRRAMIEAADLQDIEQRVEEISGRISKLTPPPDVPKDAPEVIPPPPESP
jgi:hypothetical protein